MDDIAHGQYTYQLPHQLSLSSTLRPSVTSLLDINWPLQRRLKGRNTDYFSVGLSLHAQSISTHMGSSSFSWKLGHPAVRTEAVRCPEVQKITVQNIRAWGPLNAVMCIHIGEKVCEYTLQVSMGSTWIFVMGLLLHWSCDLNNWFLKHSWRNIEAKQRESLLVKINRNFFVFKQHETARYIAQWRFFSSMWRQPRDTCVSVWLTEFEVNPGTTVVSVLYHPHHFRSWRWEAGFQQDQITGVVTAANGEASLHMVGCGFMVGVFFSSVGIGFCSFLSDFFS